MTLRSPRFIRRVLALFRWRSRIDDMEREMAFHVDSLARDYARDGAGQPQPAVELGLCRAASLPRQRVELGVAVVLGGAPFGLDQALLFHAIERRIERSLFHVQHIIG